MSRPFCSAHWKTFSRCLSKYCSVRRFCSGTAGFSRACNNCLLIEGASVNKRHPHSESHKPFRQMRGKMFAFSWPTALVCFFSSYYSVTFYRRRSSVIGRPAKSGTYPILAALLSEGLYKQKEGLKVQEVPAGTEWELPRVCERPTVPRPAPAALYTENDQLDHDRHLIQWKTLPASVNVWIAAVLHFMFATGFCKNLTNTESCKKCFSTLTKTVFNRWKRYRVFCPEKQRIWTKEVSEGQLNLAVKCFTLSCNSWLLRLFYGI